VETGSRKGYAGWVNLACFDDLGGILAVSWKLIRAGGARFTALRRLSRWAKFAHWPVLPASP